MEVRRAVREDVGVYAAFGRAAQARLRTRRLEQYVPAAHDEYADAILARVEAGTLYAVWDGGSAVAFFSLDPAPSPWWPADGEPALYLAGMVVSQQARGRGVGGHIIRWWKILRVAQPKTCVETSRQLPRPCRATLVRPAPQTPSTPISP